MMEKLDASLIARAVVWVLLIVGIALLVSPAQYSSLLPLVAVAAAVSLSIDFFLGS